MKRFLFLIPALCVASVGCDGGGDGADGGGSATAVELLELLLDVDGNGSGLDSDTIDGIESDELARAGTRTTTIQLNSVRYDDTPDTVFDDTTPASLNFRFRVPADAVPGQPIDVYVAGSIESGAPCGVKFTTLARSFTAGPLTLIELDSAIEGGDVLTVSNNLDVNEIKFTVSEPNPDKLVPGTWLDLSLLRLGDDGSDTCTLFFNLLGIAVEYSAR